MALGRRIREVLVGVPAIVAWIIIFKKDKKKVLALARTLFFHGELCYFLVNSG